MAVELGTAYISIVPTTKNMQGDITRALRGLDKVGSKAGADLGKSVETGFGSTGLGAKLTGAVSKSLKGGLIGIGAAAGGTMAAAFAKGFGRLNALDQAEAKLKGLGFGAADVERAMEGVTKSVKGTAFGLDEAAGSAAKFTGVGMKIGDELDRAMKLTADIAAQAGTGMDDVSNIIAKIAGAGKVTGETLAQLDERAVGASDAIAKHLGVSIDEARAKISAGEVDFETFSQAMEKKLGGAALSTGDTVKGSMDNMMSALGRFGAKLLEPVFSNAPAVFGAVGASFDELGTKLEPVITQFADWLAPKMENLAQNVIPGVIDGVMGVVDGLIQMGTWIKDNSTWLVPLTVTLGTFTGGLMLLNTWQTIIAAGGLLSWLKNLSEITKISTAVQAAFNAVMAMNPIALVVTAVAALAAGLIYFFTQTETGRALWEQFTTALASGWQWVTDQLTAGWNWIVQNVWNPLMGWVASVQARWAAFTGDLVGKWEWFKAIVAAAVETVKAKIGEMVTNVTNIPGKIQSAFSNARNLLVDKGREIINGLWSGLQDAWSNVTSWFSDLPSRILNAFGSVSFSIGGIFSRNGDGSFAQYVAGGIDQLERYANGGGRENHTAQIARGGAWRVWAEPETGGEAYIPLAAGKRSRSEAILNRVAELFGYTLVDGQGMPFKPGYRGDLGPQDVHAFEDGGITGKSIEDFVHGRRANGWQASRSLEGAPYVWGGSNWGDCSGAMSAVAAFAVGINPFPRKFATGSQAQWLSQHGFKRGRGGEGDLRIGFLNGGPAGGHTSGTLPNGVNIEMGGGRGNGQIGGGAAGAWDSYYDTFFYLPVKKKEMEKLKVADLGSLSTDSTTTSNAELASMTAAATVAETRALTPQEVGAATFASEMGNRSLGEIGLDVLGGFFGTDFALTKKLLFTPMGDLVGSGSDYAVGQPRTNVAEDHAKENHQSLIDQWLKNPTRALAGVVKNLGIFDTGGLLKHGHMALNLGGGPERILDKRMTPIFDRFMGVMPAWMDSLDAARGEVKAAWSGEDAGYASVSRYLGDARALDALNGLEAAGSAHEQVVNFFVDEDDLISAREVRRMINDGVSGLRAELKGRRPVAAASTRGGVM